MCTSETIVYTLGPLIHSGHVPTTGSTGILPHVLIIMFPIMSPLAGILYAHTQVPNILGQLIHFTMHPTNWATGQCSKYLILYSLFVQFYCY